MSMLLNRRLIVLAIFVLVLLLAGAGRSWQFYDQPFSLNALIQLSIDRGFIIQPTEAIRKVSNESSIHINSRWNLYPAYIPKLYIIDAERIENTEWFPRRLKRFVKQELYSGGVTFACERTTLLDGSILKRSPNSVGSKMSGISEEYLKNIPGESSDWLLMIFLHESVHLLEVHVGGELSAKLEKRFDDANNLLRDGKFDLASSNFKSIYTDCPAYFKAVDHEALAQRRLGNESKALELYKLSLRIRSDNEIALQNIVPLLIEAGQIDDALSQAEVLTSLHKENPEGYFWSGVINFGLKNTKAALAGLEKARGLYVSHNQDMYIHVDLLSIGHYLTEGELQKANDTYVRFKSNCQRLSVKVGLSSYCAEPTKDIFGSAIGLYRSFVSKVSRSRVTH